MATNIKVAIRVRPFNKRETELGSTCVVSMDGPSTTILAPDAKTFTYDFSYWSHDQSQTFASQDVVWNDIGEVILKNALDGFNGCLFAYGQTGSGKSYSVLGPEPPGIIPRAVQRVFEEKATLEQDDTMQLCVWVSYLEIYQEHIHDLLCPKQDHAELKVMQHPKLGVYVPNLTEDACESPQKVEELMDFGVKRRAVAATQMNATSSRSHAVFCIKVERLEGAKPQPGAPDSRHALTAKINLVDLAGSERQSKTGAEGSTLKEGAAINKSLSALGMVIKDLSEAHGKVKGDHHDAHGKLADASASVPFRSSKLTFLLKDSLAGNSRTYMMAAISPASDNAEETLSTLRFASSVKAIKTVSKQNKDKKDALIEELRQELEDLQKKSGVCLLRKSGGGGAVSSEEVKERERCLDEMKRGFEHQIQEGKELEELRKGAVDHGALSQEDMQKMLGVDSDVPYLLNMAEDPTTAGKLLYYLPTKKTTSVGSSEDSGIRFSGMGVSAHLADISNEDNHNLTITKCGQGGRIVHDGSAMKPDESRPLKHGQQIFVGRAIALKLVVPAMAQEDFAAHELLLHGLEEEWSAIDASPSMERVEGFLSQVCQEMTPDSATAFVRRVKEAAAACDEANELTAAMCPGEGLAFDITFTLGKPPSIVVHASKTTDEDEPRTVYLCTDTEFQQHLHRMHDYHFVFQKRSEVDVEAIHNPWEETCHVEIHHYVESLKAKVAHLGATLPEQRTVRFDGQPKEPRSPAASKEEVPTDITTPVLAAATDEQDRSANAPALDEKLFPSVFSSGGEAVVQEEASQRGRSAAVSSKAGIVIADRLQQSSRVAVGSFTSSPSSSYVASAYPPTPRRVAVNSSASWAPSPSAASVNSSARFVLVNQPAPSPRVPERIRVGSPGPSRRCRGRSAERSMSPVLASRSVSISTVPVSATRAQVQQAYAAGDRVKAKYEGQWYEATVLALSEDGRLQVHCDADREGTTLTTSVENVIFVRKAHARSPSLGSSRRGVPVVAAQVRLAEPQVISSELGALPPGSVVRADASVPRIFLH